MSNSSIPVLKFLFTQDFRILSEALASVPQFEVEEFQAANDLATYLTTVPAGLVITSLRNRNDLIQIATFMKIVKQVAKDIPFKIVVLNLSGDRTFDKAIAKLGIQDQIEPAINTKALKFKIDFWMKSLNAQVKSNPNGNDQKVLKGSEGKKAENKADSTKPVWTEALDLEDDIWILKQDNDCKKVLSRWLIRLLGPSPYIGQWVELSFDLWRFDIKESEKEMYVPNEGAWYFSGEQKPEFVWKENVWLIAGDSFDLFFKDSKKTSSRLKAKDKSLTVCKNSIFAKTKETIIIESFDKDLVFKKEAGRLEDMEGKDKTDNLGNGHLEGKNKTSEEKSGQLSGKIEGAEVLNQENHEQKTKTGKEGTFWKGKNVYEKEEGKADLSVKTEAVKESPNLERERKDGNHQKYYKNHNEAEKYEAVPEKERESALKKEKQDGPLAGKSSTDELSKHYDNSRMAKEREEERAKNANDRTGNKTEAELSGKSETDKLKSHYGQRERQEKASEADAGKTKTSAGHFASSSEEERNMSELSEKEQRSTKTTLEKNWEGQHDYGFQNEEEKSAGQLLSLQKAREEKNRQKTEEEKELDELTRDAKVISLLIHHGRQVSCDLNDFFDDTIIFETKENGIKSDSKVSLDLTFIFKDKDSRLKMDGRVVTVDDDGEGNNYVTIQISPNHTSEFDTFMQLYFERQQNINEFLKKTKGL